MQLYHQYRACKLRRGVDFPVLFVSPLLLSNHCTDCFCFFSLDDSLDMSTTLSLVSGTFCHSTCLPQAQLHFLCLVMIAASLFSHSHCHLAVWWVDSHFHWFICILRPTQWYIHAYHFRPACLLVPTCSRLLLLPHFACAALSLWIFRV